MKQEFDKLGVFRCSLNALAKLYCNTPDAYSEAEAKTELGKLMEQWHCNEDYVIAAVFQMAQSAVDKRLRYLMQQTISKLQLPVKNEDFIKDWEKSTQGEKRELVDNAISYLERMKRREQQHE